MHKITKELFNLPRFVMTKTYNEQYDDSWKDLEIAVIYRDIKKVYSVTKRMLWLAKRMEIEYLEPKKPDIEE